MYEFTQIDGVWRIQWGPSTKKVEPKPVPTEKVVIVPFVQVEASKSDTSKPEYVTAA